MPVITRLDFNPMQESASAAFCYPASKQTNQPTVISHILVVCNILAVNSVFLRVVRAASHMHRKFLNANCVPRVTLRASY